MSTKLVEWSDDFSVGYKGIDLQHMELVHLVNDFHAGIQKGGLMSKVYFLQTIKGAVKYVKTHFETEESIMMQVNYPYLNEHKKEHENFINEVTRQIQSFEKADNPDPTGFDKYLLDWILNHIANSDKKYSPYLKDL